MAGKNENINLYGERSLGSDGEKRGGTGKHKEKRRPSRKAYSDINFLCNHIEKKGRKAGANIDDRSLANARKTFQAAEKAIHGREKRKDQLKWRTLVRKIRIKLKAAPGSPVG